jgi:transposase
MRSKADAGDALNSTIRDVGIPELGIHTDNAGEESGVSTEWERMRRHFLIPQTFVEPYLPWMNRAELEIGAFKSHYQRNYEPESLSGGTLVLRCDVHVRYSRVDCSTIAGGPVIIGTDERGDTRCFRIPGL